MNEKEIRELAFTLGETAPDWSRFHGVFQRGDKYFEVMCSVRISGWLPGPTARKAIEKGDIEFFTKWWKELDQSVVRNEAPQVRESPNHGS